jgi:hypothetical protein
MMLNVHSDGRSMQSKPNLAVIGWIVWSVVIVLGLLAIFGAFAFGLGAFGALFVGGEVGVAGRMVLLALVLLIAGVASIVLGATRIAKSRTGTPEPPSI